MRVLPIIVMALLASDAAAARRLPLELPIRYPDADPERVPAPAYAGEVLTLRLHPTASRAAWVTRAQMAPMPAGRSALARPMFSQLGVASLDRAAAELGGVRFTPEFRGATPPSGEEPDFTAFYVAHLPRGLALETALDRFAALPEVAEVSPIAIMPVTAIPNDSLWSTSTWYYQPPSRQDIHAPEAWDITTGDTSIVVGIADTGVLSWHPDLGGTVAGLSGQIFTNWVEAGGVAGVDDDANGYVDDVHGWDFVALTSPDNRPGEDWQDEDNDPSDYVSHGTSVAGVVGALTDNTIGVAGTAWRVRLMPLRMGWACASCTAGGDGAVRMDFFAEAVHYAVQKGVDIINCSFQTAFEPGLEAALNQAAAAGTIVVAAAGNQGTSITSCSTCYLTTRPEVVTVAATNPSDQLTGFTNYGPEVDVAAPGVGIAVPSLLRNEITFEVTPSYRTFNGTSFSAPLVSGGVALLQAQQRQLGLHRLLPEGVLLRLFETADDISAQNPTRVGQYGGGRLNLFRALDERWRSQVIRTGARVNGVSAVLEVNDGSRRVAFVAQNQQLVVVDGATLDTIATATLVRAPVTGVTAGNLGGTAGVGLFVGMTGGVAGFAPDGSVLPGWPQLTPIGVQLNAGPAIGDLDDDGVNEVVCGDSEGLVYAWRADGSTVPGFPVQATSTGMPHPVTLARFGNARIIVADNDGRIIALTGGGAVVPGWPVQIQPPGNPTTPVEMNIGGTSTVLVAVGGQLHALQPDGTRRPGFPVSFGAAIQGREELAIGDIDQNGHDDIVIPCFFPQRLEVRDSTGAALSTLNWPRALGSVPIGSPVIGHLSGGAAPEIMVMLSGGLAAFEANADSIRAFPKLGGAGVRPSLADLDGDGTTEVVAGSGPSLPRLFVYDAGPGTAGSEAPWPTFRGNYARTGSRSNNPGPPIIDLIAPGGVGDLRAELRGPNTVALLWTAPGNDGMVGALPAYEVRRLLQPIDAGNFHLGTLVPSGTPAAPGTPDSVLVTGLTEGLVHYFALRGRDQSNAGPISNQVTAVLPVVSPGAVTDLRVATVTDSSVTLAWTATGDDGAVGRPRLYRVHAAFEPIDDANFFAAPYTRIVDATVDGGELETLFYRFLERGRHYWFALKAYDLGGNVSPLSNGVDATTRVGGPLAGDEGLALSPGRNPSRVPASLYWQAAIGGDGATHTLAIFDLGGRRVRSVTLGAGVGGVVSWDGRDDNGNILSAGLYLMRLSNGAATVKSRIVLLP